MVSRLNVFRELYRDEFLLKFCNFNQVLKSESYEVTQKHSKVSKTVKSRRDQTKIGLCGEQKTSTDPAFLTIPKSEIGTLGLNIGLSESEEDSIFV